MSVQIRFCLIFTGCCSLLKGLYFIRYLQYAAFTLRHHFLPFFYVESKSNLTPNVMIPKHPLHAQFDEVLSEIFEVKGN